MPWTTRYRERDTPWDVGGPHPELAWRIGAGLIPAQGRALVPGCGFGHDALALARHGLEVVALDMVEALREEVGPALAELGGRFVCGDALAFDENGFDLVFDHTFFCAIEPELRPAYGAMVRRALRHGGQVQSLVFPADKPADQGGPPFRMSAQDLGDVLGPDFRMLSEGLAEHRVERRDWQERWAIWVRKERSGGDSPRKGVAASG